MFIPIVILALMLYTVPSEAAQKDVVVKGKPVKTVVLKDRAGRKTVCQIVIDKNTKKEYTVCK